MALVTLPGGPNRCYGYAMERIADNIGAVAGWWLPLIAAILAFGWIAPKIHRTYHDWMWRAWKRRQE